MIPWWVWVSASQQELKAAGGDPSKRIEHCGHARALSPQWCLSIGMWGGVHFAKDIREAVGASDKAYERFKSRHSLTTAGRHSEGRCEQWDLSLSAYVAMENMMRQSKRLAPGHAANTLSKRYKEQVQENLGVLPVELLRRWEVIKDLMFVHDLTVADLNDLEDSTLAIEHMKRWGMVLFPQEQV